MKFLTVVISVALLSAVLAEHPSPIDQFNAHLVRLAEAYNEVEGGEEHEGNGGDGGRRYAGFPPGHGQGGERGRQPNIVLVVADDLGFNDVGFSGSTDIKTPNLDALASEGVILDNYYTQAVCTPSRVQLLSGVHEVAAGLCHEVIHSAQRNGLPLVLPTLANKLQELGYANHMVGKWNLGHWEKDFLPTNRGFDSFYGFVNALTDHYTHSAYERFKNSSGILNTFNGHDLWENDVQTNLNDGVHTTDLLTQRFQSIFDAHTTGPNKEQPFFFDISYGAPHWPLEVADEYLTQYAHIADINRRTYAGMVSAMDVAIGNIVSTLKSKTNVWENTIFIFTNDNGAVPFFGGNNFPLRGRKQTWFEGGVKGVAFVTSPLIQRRYRGRKSDGWIHISDFYPTLVNLAHGSTSGQSLNGFNVWDSINGNLPTPRLELLHGIDVFIPPKGANRPNSAFNTSTNAAIRVNSFKLITGDPVDGNWYASPYSANNLAQPRIGPHPPYDQVVGQEQMAAGYIYRNSTGTSDPNKNYWLFDISRDPFEQNDISDTFPYNLLVDGMLERLQYYKTNVMTPCIFPRMDMLAAPVNFAGNFFPWAENGLPAPIF